MSTYSWTGAVSADFANAANWIDEDTGLSGAGVPGPGDTVALSGAGQITGTGTVGALDVPASFTGVSHYILDGAFSARSVADLGALTVMRQGLLAERIDVGSPGSGGLLSIQQSSVGALAGSLDVNVSDGLAAGYIAELDLGNPQEPGFGPGGTLALGEGTLRIGAGLGEHGLVVADGVISGGSGSSLIVGKDGGTGLLDAPEGAADITAGRLVIGDSGTGEVNLSLGGTLLLGTGQGLALALGVRDGAGAAAGFGSLQGTDLTATVDGAAFVGETGQGSLSLAGSSLTTLGGLVIGDQAGASGTVTLDQVAWADTGNVVVGASGSGSLVFGDSYQPHGPFGSGTIDGDVQVGLQGSGAVTLRNATLTVVGNTLLGAAASDTISIQGDWNSAGHAFRLLGAAGNAPAMQAGDFVSVSYGHLEAGFLSVGAGDTLEAFDNGTLTLGVSAAGTAGSIDGLLVVAQGSTLTAAGNLSVSNSFHNGSADGLFLGQGGVINLTASASYALSLKNKGVATVQGGTLTAAGGILAAGGYLLLEGGTVSAVSSRIALDIASGGGVFLRSGQLDTVGELSVNDSDRRPGQFQPGTLTVASGAVLNSSAATPDGLAVAINSGFATISAATWTIDGRAQVGANAYGGTLTANGAVVDISGALQVGGAQSSGRISTGITDTVISGGTLSAGQTGIAAASIAVGGDGSYLTTGTLDIGTALARGHLTIDGGTVAANGTAYLDGVLHVSDGGRLSAATISLENHAVIWGSGTLQADSIVVQGDVTVGQGSLAFLGFVTGRGELHLGATTLQLADGASSGVAIAFGPAGTLVTPSLSSLSGTLSGWQQGDSILFTSQTIASDSYANGTLSLFDSTHGLLGTEIFSGSLRAANFSLTSEQGTGTLLSFHR